MTIHIRILVTALLGILVLLLQLGIRNSWINLLTWQRGPVALVSITYNLDEPYHTIALVMVMGIVFLLWLPILLGKGHPNHI